MSYSIGTVYKIVCSLNERIIYIGSTFNQLRHRWQMHKNGYNKYLHGKHRCVSIYPYFTKYGIDNFKIMKIKDYECYRENKADARHLHAFEQLWINKTKGCVNKNYAFSISKLYWKEYRESNKDKISERKKEYRESNKDKISERKKEYRESNKDKISEYWKEYRESNKDKLSDYYKKYKEANKDKLSEQNKKYYEANKDKLSEQNKKYYEANKDKLSDYYKKYYEANKDKTLERQKQRVNCSICNKELAKSSLQRHMKNIHYAIE